MLEQAQAAGQKAQQDALIGQGSIFDLAPSRRSRRRRLERLGEGTIAGAGATGPAFARPVHPPIPSEEFDQAELLAVEKEAIGLFISAHPLKPLREALRARADCPLAALAERRDKDWVTVGGIIVEAKRIRTRNGDPMMFATLDDLGGAVEMLVFGKALAEHEAALAVDQVVLVRGRVDHKEAGKTCLIVQTVERVRAHASRRSTTRASRPPRDAAHAPSRSPSRCRLRVDLADVSPERDRGAQARWSSDFPGPAEVRARDRHERGHAPAAPGRGLPRAAHADAARRAGEHLRRRRAAVAKPSRADRASPAARRTLARAARRERAAALAQLHRQRDFLARWAFAVLARASPARTAASADAGADRNAMQPSSPELARADVGVTIAV